MILRAFASAFIFSPSVTISTIISTRLAVPTLCFIRADKAVDAFLMLLALIVPRARTQNLRLPGLQIIVVRLLRVLAELHKRSPFPTRPATDILSEDETTSYFENIFGFVQRIHVFVVLQLRTLGLAWEDLSPDVAYVPSRLQ